MSLYGGSDYTIKPLSDINSLSFFNDFLEYNNPVEFPNLKVIKIDNGINLEIKNTGKKDSNIFFHLEKLIERKIFNENYSLERTKLYGNIHNKSLLESLI